MGRYSENALGWHVYQFNRTYSRSTCIDEVTSPDMEYKSSNTRHVQSQLIACHRRGGPVRYAETPEPTPANGFADSELSPEISIPRRSPRKNLRQAVLVPSICIFLFPYFPFRPLSYPRRKQAL